MDPLHVATASTFIAGIGLFLNWWAVKENTKTRQLQLMNDVFKSIKETELLLYKEYKSTDAETKKEWDSLFFNSIEQFAFLVNEKYIKDKKIAGFFDDAVVMWYEEIFLKPKHYTKEEIDNPKIFPEFKKLYFCIKSKRV
ncbi:MAG: hypothetical protein DRN66_00445 [Candidatus Nanohalarchaeota archaeon]|nr:MAG: hypothetical protein DRN66_00445 [Candidatus Nanohaloarchaeota archaeon]